MDRVTIDLPRELIELLQEAVASGAYASKSQVVAQALATWDERAFFAPRAVAWLREQVAEGLASGVSEPLDMTEIKQAARAARQS